MITVDIDKQVDDIFYMVAKTNMLRSPGLREAEMHSTRNAIKSILATQRTTLKAELLAKMPKKQSTKTCLRPAIPEAYNEAIDEITKLVESL